MQEQRFILEPYNGPSSRHRCPSCGKQREFTFYLDTQTGDYLPDHVGRCNRELNCGYHYTPKQYFAENRIKQDFEQVRSKRQGEARKPIDTIPLDLLQKTINHFDKNNLFRYLEGLFTKEVAFDLFKKYLIGTSSHWKGATIFWQLDIHGLARQCKIMLYDANTGKRVRVGATVDKFNWRERRFETVIADQDCTKIFGRYIDASTQSLNLQQCFFGEHLLTEYPKCMVAIVESEKTALIASVYFPTFIWLATGGKYGCKWNDYSVAKVLHSRSVVLFPDACLKKKETEITPYEYWKKVAALLQSQLKCRIHVSDLLEKKASKEEKSKGLDLADYLVARDDKFGWALTNNEYPAAWDYKLLNPL